MKIIHISENYFEGWGYQENLLSLYQKRAGHDVVVISSNKQNKVLRKARGIRGNEYMFDGIKIYRIKTYANTTDTSLFCYGLYNILNKEKPEMIFHHNLNISTLSVTARYKRSNPTIKLYVDSHVDWINESKNRVWHKFFYDILIPWQVKRLADIVNFYIGVSPLRCQYLNKVFKVPEEKVRFLPIGCDTAGAEQVIDTKHDLRNRYKISQNAFVVACGGKLDRLKGINELVEACGNLRKRITELRLLLFGKIEKDVMQIIETKDWIIQMGWCDRITTLKLLKMSDVACWPWLHTTLIEDSIAAGVPIVVKKSDNVSHFINEQAGIFMDNGDIVEIEESLFNIKANVGTYKENVMNARNKYSYAKVIERLADESFYKI